jgi:hypothetical protein
MELLTINDSGLLYHASSCYTVRSYYLLICKLIYQILKEQYTDKRILVVFLNGNQLIDKTEENYKKYDHIIYIYFNLEHTMVRIGARDTSGGRDDITKRKTSNVAVVGVGEDKNENYLIHLDNYDILKKKDIIVDYSVLNVIHMANCGKYLDFAKKMTCVSPILYRPITFSSRNRGIACLTTYVNTNEPRRRQLLDKAGSKITNVNNCFSDDKSQSLYLNTKVMINTHQTQHHHVVEELRILPAICCGVIVVCERSPLTEHLPYKNFVVWSDYDTIIEKADEVLKNYEEYYNTIYGDIGKLNAVLNKMENDSYNSLNNKIKEIVENAEAS